MASEELKRDKTVTKSVTRLFWQAMWFTPKYFSLTALLHAPAFFLMGVYVPLEVAYGIQAIINNNYGMVNHYAIAVILWTVIANIMLAIGTWAFNRNGVEGGAYVQKKVFSNFLAKDYEFFTNNYIGSLGSQAANLRDAFIDYNRICLFDIPKAATTIVASLAVLAYKSILLAAITVVCMTLVLLFTIWTSRFRLHYRRLVSEAMSNLAGVLGDALSHGVTVKSFANENYESQRLDAATSSWSKAQLKSWDLFTPANSGRNLLLAGATALLLIFSARLYREGAISLAIVALVQLYVIRIINTTIDITQIIKSYESVMGRSYHTLVTMAQPSLVSEPSKPQAIGMNREPAITLERVTFQYSEANNKQLALKDISLAIKTGEKIGLVGYSGSGKTTLTKLLLRFIDVTSGKILIHGVDLRSAATQDIRKHIAYVPQEPLLFHRSIRENIGYARPTATFQAIKKAGAAAYVDEFVNTLPKGYDTIVGEHGIKLSGGQRQRVAIARALLKNAPVLVLDEATSALDSQSEHYIQEALWKLMEHRTAIVVAHRLSTIQRLDRIVVMNNGEIVQIGTHDELLEDKTGHYARLWQHQSDGYLAEPNEET